MTSVKYGFIGFGNMAKAIWMGMENNGFASPSEAAFFTPNPESQQQIQQAFQLNFLPLNELVLSSDILLFCVKPQQLSTVLEQLPPLPETTVIVSVLAGTPIAAFEAVAPRCPIIRVMPNTPATYGKGVSALCYNQNVKPEHRDMAVSLFSQCGLTLSVDESQMDAVTAISGSGPAFLYQLSDIMMTIAQEHGIDYQSALQMSAQTLIGAGHMLLKSNKTTEKLISEVRSPNGTTEAGLNEWSAQQIDSRLSSVFNAAISRSKALGSLQKKD